jgi:hypothetical protein
MKLYIYKEWFKISSSPCTKLHLMMQFFVTWRTYWQWLWRWLYSWLWHSVVWEVCANILDGRIWRRDFLGNGTYHPNYTALHVRRRFPNTDDANRLADTAHEGVEVGGNDVSVLQVTGDRWRYNSSLYSFVGGKTIVKVCRLTPTPEFPRGLQTSN